MNDERVTAKKQAFLWHSPLQLPAIENKATLPVHRLCGVFQKNTRSKMYSFGWSSVQLLKSYSKYKRAEASGA